jgi:hypothetical protein
VGTCLGDGSLQNRRVISLGRHTSFATPKIVTAKRAFLKAVPDLTCG